jgi:hypothetical protein
MGKTKPLEHRYSGGKSKIFWQYVRVSKNHKEMYSLGVALQNLEEFVLKRMKDENPKFVERSI